MEHELDVIRRIAARLGVREGLHVGIGDDAAVLDDSSVLALDMVVDGVHVRRSTHSPADIGHTALAVNLSDIAAMGATPIAAVVGLGLPPDFSAREVEEMYDAMEALATAHGMSVAGGDISTSPVLTISLAIVGRMAHGEPPVLRSGARTGDVVVVTGPLGASASGRHLLADPILATSLAQSDALITAHRRPNPRVKDGQHLAHVGATSMMDISDGLLMDAGRLGRASGLQVQIDLDAVPLAPGVDRVAAALGRDPQIFAATGGEDYHLVATLPDITDLASHLVVVGRMVTGQPGVMALRAGADVTPARLGWEHGDSPDA